MTGCGLLVLGLVLPARLAAQEPTAPAFVEVVPQAASVWLHEPCEVLVRIGVDTAWFAASAVPLFQQRLDQPFQLDVPWLSGAADRAVEFVAPAVPGARIAVGDRIAVAVPAGQRQQGGRTFDLLELRYRWVPLAAGVSAIAPVALRYAFATRFADDFLRGRQPLDRQETSVFSPSLQLTVRALPSEGRPAGFAGAVGEFTVSAHASVTTVPVGSSFTLAIEVAGAGNLDRMPPLAWPVLPGFHVQGLVERRAPGVRTFQFDVLALRAGAVDVPAVSFVAFSPRAGAYVQRTAGPVPLSVTALAAGTVLPPRVQQLVDADALAVRGSLPWWGVAVAVFVLFGGWNGWRWRRRHVASQHAHDAARARLVAALREGPEATLRAFEAVCARRAGDDAFTLDGVWARLELLGAGAEVIVAARRLHAELDSARYGGLAPPADAVLAVADRLTASRR